MRFEFIKINNLFTNTPKVSKLYQATDSRRKPGFTLCPEKLGIAAALLGLLAASPLPARVDPGTETDALRESIRVEIELLREPEVLSTGSVEIAAADLIAEVYERRGFAPAWTESRRIDSLLAAVHASFDDGLDPDDYHRSRIEEALAARAAGNAPSAKELAVFDLMLTDSLVRLGYHERYGKVNPERLDPVWNFGRPLRGSDAAAVVEGVLAADDVGSALRQIFPRGPVYARLRDQLRMHREIAAAGSWPTVPDGPTLRPGTRDDRLQELASRLAASGDLGVSWQPADITVYDETLQAAVRHFQERHGLDTDAIVGKRTLEALNVPVERRIDQIRLSLERARWVAHNLEPDFVLVNVAGFVAYLVRDGELAWSTRVVVGRTVTKTPLFRATMKYVVFNPDWTVPWSIATKEILPAIRNDPAYLARNHYEIRNRDGNAVDPLTVDWSTITERNFPFTVVQLPGPWNALGRVKFMFPNEHAIYLHDTPSRSLFDRAERAFSHGCIRVQEPLDFAERLLGRDGWTRERIDAQIASGDTKTVLLSETLPVLLLYWTAEVDPDGHIHFYNDVYERDAAVLDALEAPFHLDLPGS